MPHATPPTIIVADTSVLINFLCIDYMDLIAAHSHGFIITSHVEDEMTKHYPEQLARLQIVLKDGVLQWAEAASEGIAEMFARLWESGRLGAGECSAIALASYNGYILAIDDRAALNQAKREDENMSILTTQDLVVSMIREGILSVENADAIKYDWTEKHSFHLKINSFSDLV